MDDSNFIDLRERAMDGDREAIVELADIYENGLWGVAADPEQARYWKEKADELNETDDPKESVSVQEEQEPQQEIIWEGMEVLRGASLIHLHEEVDQGNPYACVLLGWRYIEADKSEGQVQATQGAELIKQAITIGKSSVGKYREVLAEAYWRLGLYYERQAEMGDPNQYSSAFECYSVVVRELEDYRAASDLARCYENGIGCHEDEAMAQKLREEVARNGGAWERFYLAERFYRKGSQLQATLWYQNALKSEPVEEYEVLLSTCRYRLSTLGEPDSDGEPCNKEEERLHLIAMAQNHDACAAWFCSQVLAVTDTDKIYYLELGQGGLPKAYGAQCGNELRNLRARHEKARAEEEKERFEKEKKIREEEAQIQLERNIRKHKNKNTTIIGTVAAVIAVLVIFINVHNSPANQVMRAYDSGDYEEAVELYQDLVRSNTRQSNRLNKKIDQELSSITSKYENGKIDESELTVQMDGLYSIASSSQKAEINEYLELVELYTIGKSAFESGNYIGAISYLSQLEKGDPNYKAATSLISDAEELYRVEILELTVVDEGSESLTDYIEAMNIVSIALDTLSGDKKLTERLEDLTEAYVELVLVSSDVDDTEELTVYIEALTLLAQALKVVPDNTEILEQTEKLSTGYVQQVLYDIDISVDELDFYEDAISVLTELNSIVPGSVTIQSQLNELTSAYVDFVTNEVNNLCVAYNYDEAADLAARGKATLPTNDELKAVYESTQPILLWDIQVVESDNFINRITDEDIEDTYGNVYEAGNCVETTVGWSLSSYAIFYLNEKYACLTGTVACSTNLGSSNTASLIITDQDGNELYQISDIERTTQPINFSIDVSGVDSIRVYATYQIILDSFYLYE